LDLDLQTDHAVLFSQLFYFCLAAVTPLVGDSSGIQPVKDLSVAIVVKLVIVA